MSATAQERGWFAIGCFCLLFLLGSSGTASTSYPAIYATNLADASQLSITDTSFLPTSLKSQLHLSISSTVHIVSSEFHLFSSATLNERQKRESACDYDTSGMIGDRYVIQIQIDDTNVYHTSVSPTQFRTQSASAMQRYSSLTLPFKLQNGTVITIPMALCKFGTDFRMLATCHDKIRNQDETDIDCGGVKCACRCDIDQKCSRTADCKNPSYVAGICSGESAKILAACKMIKKKMSSASQVLYPSDPGYNESISHYILTFTTRSVCSVLPDTANDVATILKTIGQYRVPFAIKGGGHAFSQDFSSTVGVHVSMSRFQKVIYHQNKQTVDLGAGLIWDDAYEVLEPDNVTVVGGRISGVGVAGLVLGGGYSWKSNQYGLSIDTIFEYELVTPSGRIIYVNNESYPDLFFGLKGGFNNFGIVTNFNMRAVPQTQVYGGILIYTPPQFNALAQAFGNFQGNNKDPKAQIIGYLSAKSGQIVFILYFFYDAPTTPSETFNDFLVIFHSGSLQTQSYTSFFKSTYFSGISDLRCRIRSFSLTSTSTRFVNGVINQTIYLNSKLGPKDGAYFIFGVEPFLSTYLDKSQGGAYPHFPSSTPLVPFFITFCWRLSSDDDVFIKELKSTYNVVFQMALNDGQDIGGSKQIIYPNYASDDTPLSQMYGNNVPRLRRIRKAWDPDNVMYLAGGFKF